MERFQDRAAAGRELAAALMHLAEQRPVVLGLARGGVVVAAEIAARLDSPLEVLVARKIAAASHPEYGIGAVAPGGITVIDNDAVRRVAVTAEELEEITAREQRDVERRLSLYRGDRPLELAGRCAIVVDDGLATGITAVASCRYVRSLGPSRLVFAVPVSSCQGAELVRREVDEFVSIEMPSYFQAVGAWYGDFVQTTDEEVLGLLARNQAGRIRRA